MAKAICRANLGSFCPKSNNSVKISDFLVENDNILQLAEKNFYVPCTHMFVVCLHTKSLLM